MRAARPDDDSPLRPARTSWRLAAGGAALLAVQAALTRGLSADAPAWPWEVVRDEAAPLALRTMHLLWALAGLWCLVLGFTRAARTRATGAVAFAAVLLALCAGGVGWFALGTRGLAGLIALGLLGAGLAAAGEPAVRRGARAVAALGALLYAWGLATTFTPAGPNHLQAWWEAVQADPAALGHGRLPQALLLLAALTGVLVALGLTVRWARWTGTVLLVAGLAAPAVQDTLSSSGSWSLAQEAPVFVAVVLTWLAAESLADLGRARA